MAQGTDATPGTGNGTVLVCIAAEDEEAAYRIVDLISGHHPASEPQLRHTADGMVACALRAHTLRVIGDE
ncbi:hypothetical protein ACFYXS_13670 [Streptomyces sp. NPDC002574]|uniref:hypothetical protein n=1 Tax=Streptomyces sp. NPDC002574 TaxID=3364652 RepID=UPI00368580AE